MQPRVGSVRQRGLEGCPSPGPRATGAAVESSPKPFSLPARVPSPFLDPPGAPELLQRLGRVPTCSPSPAAAWPRGLGTGCPSFPQAAPGAPAPCPHSVQTAPCMSGAAASPSRPPCTAIRVSSVPQRLEGAHSSGQLGWTVVSGWGGRGACGRQGVCLMGSRVTSQKPEGCRCHQPDVWWGCHWVAVGCSRGLDHRGCVCALVTRSEFPGKVTHVVQDLSPQVAQALK